MNYSTISSAQTIPICAIEQLKNCLEKPILLHRDNLLVFICGAQTQINKSSGRDTLVTYAQRHYPDHKFFLAEQVFESLPSHKADLLSIENQLTKYSDCIIIVLESPGAFAELGAFVNKDSELLKILLPINDISFKDKESFINLGPLELVNRKSMFKPTIFANFEYITDAIPEIEARLSKVKKAYRKKINLKTISDYYKLKPKEKLFFILDLVTIFQPIRKSELIQLFQYLFSIENIILDYEVGMLFALRLVIKKNEYYIKAIGEHVHFIDFDGINLVNLRAKIMNHYFKYNPEKISAIETRLK